MLRKQMPNRHRNEAGFTMVELLVGLVVGSVLILSVSVVIINLTITNARARDLAVANTTVENKAEALRSEGFLVLSASGDGTYDWSGEVPSTIADPVATYTVDSTLEPGLIRIQIDLAYNDQGETRDLSYTTYVTELGVGQ